MEGNEWKQHPRTQPGSVSRLRFFMISFSDICVVKPFFFSFYSYPLDGVSGVGQKGEERQGRGQGEGVLLLYILPSFGAARLLDAYHIRLHQTAVAK